LLLDGSKMVNNHFANDSLHFVRGNQDIVDGTRACMDLLYETSSAIISEHKIDFWLVDFGHST
jgi:hypothetical protein